MALKQKDFIRGFLTFSIFVIAILLIQPVRSNAQVISKEDTRLQHIKDLKDLDLPFQNQGLGNNQNELSPIPSSIDLGSLNDGYLRYTYDQSWNRNPNPNPAWNFMLYGTGTPAGNINGDSSSTGFPINDYVVSKVARNEKTPELEDMVWKTAVFYGNNTTGEPDQLFYRKLEPVGDLNGDGYSDAIAVDKKNSLNFPSNIDFGNYIYKGTPNGYQKTSITVDISSTSTIIGFLDIDNDGLQDVFSAVSGTDTVKVIWGQKFNTESITPQAFPGILATNSSSLMVKDVDRDGLQEIVQLSGSSSYEGQLQVIQVDTALQNLTTADAFVTEQSFAYNSFNSPANWNYLYLIDANGDDRSDILISPTNGDGPNYLLTYNKADTVYNTTPTNLYSGDIIPAGDLNVDGRQDYIIKDASDDYKPKVAFGPTNLTAGLSFDVELSGISSSNWSADIGYNRYGEMGDLDGDGIDDATLTHWEQSSSGSNVGRRILKGDEAGQFTSEFHLYPYENFFSRIYSTEELGDINGDGIEDFAMLLNYQQKVEIYFGGESISQTPDITLNLDYIPNGIAVGEFTGDNIKDLALVYSDFENSKIEFYEGGTSLTKIKTIAVSDFQSADIMDLSGIHALGDVNGDGNTDFVVGSGMAEDTTSTREISEIGEAYILYGGSNPTLGDTKSLGGIWVAERAAGLGDMDGDGKDDFAISKFSWSEVYVYLSSSESPVILSSQEYDQLFGFDLAAGDFNGDGARDLATISYQNNETPPTNLKIYFGGKDFDNIPDIERSIPNIDNSGNTNRILGELEVIPDITNDGRDELLIGSAGYYLRHAVFLVFTEVDVFETYLQAPNVTAGMGGQGYLDLDGTIATGDFNNDGETDIIISQVNDNNDALWSSRVYRYKIDDFLKITEVADVPEDQGNRIRIHVGGTFMDAMQQGLYGFDNWSVWRMAEDSSWTNVKTISPSSESASYVDVTVNNSQPTGIDSVDYSYTFRLEAFVSREGVIARSDTAIGRAFDNLAPAPVANVSVSEDNTANKVLSWESQGYQDIGEYVVYKTDISGTKENEIIGSSTDNRFSELGDQQGVQLFGVKARDVHNNLGKGSRPALALYDTSLNYNMVKGWNLIGIPVDAPAEQIQSIKESVENGAIYEFNGVYEQATELQPGKGYWAKFAAENAKQLTGMPATEMTLQLREGWNLISGIGGRLPLSLAQDNDQIIIPGTLYRFDQSYSESDTLEPGSGYWVKASTAGTITFTHPKLINKDQTKSKQFEDAPLTESKELDKEFDKLIVSDGTHERTLYFGGKLENKQAKESFTLPPLAPGDLFDARFKDGSKLLQSDEMYVKISRLPETSISIELKVEALSDFNKFTVKEFGKGRLLTEYTIEPNSPIELQNGDTDAVYIAPSRKGSLTDSEIPDKFILKQNYPNPFNPTTQIRYSIPEATEVSLEVFDLLGKKVATLVNEEKQPGTYTVNFDASNLASGIYLYRLRAGSYVSTRKLILAK